MLWRKEQWKIFGFGQRGSSVARWNAVYYMCTCDCIVVLCRLHFEKSSVHLLEVTETGAHCVPYLCRGCVAKRQSTKWLCAITGRQVMFVVSGSLRCMISRTLLWWFYPKGGKIPVCVLPALFCHYKYMQFVANPAKTCKVEEKKEDNGTA